MGGGGGGGVLDLEERGRRLSLSLAKAEYSKSVLVFPSFLPVFSVMMGTFITSEGESLKNRKPKESIIKYAPLKIFLRTFIEI